MAKSQKTNSYICKNCPAKLQQKLHVCVVTDLCRNTYVKCTTNWIMTSQILLYHNAYNLYQNAVHDNQYICSSCDKILKEISDENLVVPHYVRYPNAVTGANFLKALNQRPEYVCTCCHHMLFLNTVQQFHKEDYDMSNETVKECLSH